MIFFVSPVRDPGVILRYYAAAADEAAEAARRIWGGVYGDMFDVWTAPDDAPQRFEVRPAFHTELKP